MKKILLITLLSIATCLSAFSQSVSSKKYDLVFTHPTTGDNQKGIHIKNSFPAEKLLNDTTYIGKQDSLDEISYPDMGETSLNLNQDNLGIILNTATNYPLRIFKPTGNYPIQIYSSDSTRTYTLLIKEHEVTNH